MKKYGVPLVIESFNSVPVHKYETPSSCVKRICATDFAPLTSAGVCGATHDTSMLQAPEVPISLTVFMSGDLSAAPVIR